MLFSEISRIPTMFEEKIFTPNFVNHSLERVSEEV